ncbi:hypothetical protein MJO28_011359, partial [Puccinia striiformis f. sp. tritici]
GGNCVWVEAAPRTVQIRRWIRKSQVTLILVDPSFIGLGMSSMSYVRVENLRHRLVTPRQTFNPIHFFHIDGVADELSHEALMTRRAVSRFEAIKGPPPSFWDQAHPTNHPHLITTTLAFMVAVSRAEDVAATKSEDVDSKWLGGFGGYRNYGIMNSFGGLNLTREHAAYRRGDSGKVRNLQQSRLRSVG